MRVWTPSRLVTWQWEMEYVAGFKTADRRKAKGEKAGKRSLGRRPGAVTEGLWSLSTAPQGSPVSACGACSVIQHL